MCFIRYPNPLKSFKKTRLRLVFSTYFSVFGYLMKHTFSCLIYYLKSEYRHCCKIKKKREREERFKAEHIFPFAVVVLSSALWFNMIMQQLNEGTNGLYPSYRPFLSCSRVLLSHNRFGGMRDMAFFAVIFGMRAKTDSGKRELWCENRKGNRAVYRISIFTWLRKLTNTNWYKWMLCAYRCVRFAVMIQQRLWTLYTLSLKSCVSIRP